MPNMYNLVDYFDVWKDELGSWTVNDQCIREEGLYISPDATNKQILQFLKRIGFLKTDDMRRLYVDDYGDMIEIYARKGNMPLGALVPAYG